MAYMPSHKELNRIENQEVLSEDVTSLHNTRLLFVIYKGKLYTEDKVSGLSHIDWFRELCMTTVHDKAENMYNTCTRGYVQVNQNDTNVAFYVGDFECNHKVILDYKKFRDELFYRFNLSGEINIYLGMIKEDGKVFKPKNLLKIKYGGDIHRN